MALLAEHLVGRGEELGVLEGVLDDLVRGIPGAIELVGEPGIGKTRLICELAARAELRGCLVLSGSASELEQNLPFSVFVDALDDYVDRLDPQRLATLDGDVQAELAHVFPSLSALAGTHRVAAQHERYRSHRAVRELLHRLAARRPLVLVLDDFHWADSASVELLIALLRRPPAAAVLMTLATRPRQMPHALAGALEHADRQGVLTRIMLGALSLAQARELLGGALDSTEAAALYEESGGNPFYLQELARAVTRTARAASHAAGLSMAIGIPSAVAAALTEELAMLPHDARLVLEGAAVAGDPFEPELAAAASATSETSTLDAIDEFLRLDLVRTTDVPRRFRFRHPLVRRAVYEASPAAWRLGAHARCAEACTARGATAGVRAHHIERSAREGDLGAVAVLREAGEAAARLAPASAERWFAAALRILPQTAPAEERVGLLLARAGALAATGRFADARRVLLEGRTTIPDESVAPRDALTLACARAEDQLGRYEQAHVRLVSVLRGLPEPVSEETVALLIELAKNELYRSNYRSMGEWGERAVAAAQEVGDRPLKATAQAMTALADAMTGAGGRARSHRADAAALIESLSDDELSRRVDAAAWLAAAEAYLDLFEAADAHASRALTLARATGQGEAIPLLNQLLGRIWYVRAKLTEASELLDEAIEASRLSVNPQALVGNLFNRSVIAVATGDLDLAVDTAQESVELTRELDRGFVSAWAAVRLANALLETAEPAQAVEMLLGSAGGEELTLIPGGWRAYCLELLTRCWLALGRRDDAKRASTCAEAMVATAPLPLAAAWAERAAAAVALHDGDTAGAVALALSSAAAAGQVEAPIEAALSRTLAGRALARAGQRDRAIAELQRAATELDACGALHYRNAAERELGRLGHRIHRRTRPGTSSGVGIASLTERELQVARLVVDRKTNPQIAAELFLSQKTVETHLRHIFAKMGVPSRVALARAVQRADSGPDAHTR
ncbi:LuxR family transcriptional regulator [Nocardioides guangzhouensis]|uniref:LuxR family transcriptional regulator n=1 Tax=Nocardioides guangzhouensis TaxID=2497878 RepID=A0A4Q4ZJV2_9ACTN|nr:LuxR family transcriptional regulator [Nocardioides guangzhouensis]RYP87724.1 LuxR family transcriptional regulator [Nocardioides guangzhouensis]